MPPVQVSSKLSGERDTAVINHIKTAKLHTKFILLLLVSGLLGLLTFFFCLQHIGEAWDVFSALPPFAWDKEAFIKTLREEAPNYTVPTYSGREHVTDQMQGFFALCDDYTSVYVHGKTDGLYRASSSHEIINEGIVQYVSSLTEEYIHSPEHKFDNPIYWYDMEFENGTYTVVIYSYHYMRFTYPYLFFCLLLATAVFLAPMLLYLRKRTGQLLLLKDEMLLMSSGDLTHPVAPCGADEIGILARELNELRLALHSHITGEEESRQANQDLITALSHDLRTPLTILKGYLEVLQLKLPESDAAAEYLSRCLQKTDDIRELTDRMFEYALVYEANEEISPAAIPLSFFEECIAENMDFIRLAGYKTAEPPCLTASPCLTGRTVNGDTVMIKRIFNNLFSNILKYGDKSVPVTVSFHVEEHSISFTLCNAIKTSFAGEALRLQQVASATQFPSSAVRSHGGFCFMGNEASDKVKDQSRIASNGIGLRSVEKMMALHHGTLKQREEAGRFCVEITFYG